MPFYTDQLNRVIELKEFPKRIISLVPSQTELLFDLGLEKEVIGITKFCVHPHEWFRNKTRVGGTKSVNPDAVMSLQPDLIIANKEENIKEQVEALEKIAPVWISDICNTKDALSMIKSIGEITGRAGSAANLIYQIEKEWTALQTFVSKNKTRKLRTAYLIWKEPYMAAGGNTFIDEVLQLNGLNNVFAELERYPAIDMEQLKNNHTELVLLASEPYPFNQAHQEELQKALPGIRILLADGEMFSWYGSRMLPAAGYFQELQQLIHNTNV